MAIEKIIPIDIACSIDEVTCRLDARDIADPADLSQRIKARIAAEIGPCVTCSIGMAPNRQLAKIASDMNKPNGLTILRPGDLPGPLLGLQLDDIPGIGPRMRRRLIDAGLWTVEALWNTQPKQLRALWGNVTGERFWYALHGYDLQAEPAARSMFGHGRVLPPEWRDFDHAFEAARLLTTKAARRVRRAGYLANKFALWLRTHDDRWYGETLLYQASDDQAALRALRILWDKARSERAPTIRIKRLHVALFDLSPAQMRQHDLFLRDDSTRAKWKTISDTIDRINARSAKTLVSIGPWTPPPGGYAGGKIAFNRVPELEDFW